MRAEERSYKYRKIAVTSDDGVVDAVYNLSALADQAIALLREMTEQMEELLGDTLMVRKAKEYLDGGDEASFD